MPIDTQEVARQLNEVLQQGRDAGSSRTGYIKSISLYCSAITRLAPAGSFTPPL
jgi:hypothetical protein